MTYPFSQDELATCLRVLQAVADDPAMINEHERFKALVAKIHQVGKRQQRAARAAERTAQDSAALGTAQMRRHQLQLGPPALPAPQPSQPATLHAARPCYCCKRPFTQVHFFYHMLCPECAALNYAKRHQRADLAGRVALVTGGRVKIGYEVALRLLRDGARVIVTTRFPQSAAMRFAAEADFEAWAGRLQIYALDLRHIPTVEAFARHLAASEPALDILINNAAQTIKRPAGFYRHLLEQEGKPAPAHVAPLLPAAPMPSAPLLEATPGYQGALPALRDYFPEGLLDLDGQQVDHTPTNSWVLRLDQVGTVELLEVQLVNAIAPFVLAAQLKPLMLRSPHARRFVVHVSAMEGQFSRASKTVYHPHTNMAKAALNMLTRTSAADYAQDGIYMNSVDTGWVTDENPAEKRDRIIERSGFTPPLDNIDGMARIYDPIAQGVGSAETPLYGHFLKDFRPFPW
ncbi:SDR family NAD(P)-dependent oxidoreductase [Chloroflexia bacterium SDU3-3]|nr:SDR family NAD(P)-dependent oxidoreductase [Chloroflexia bacterium SDU3-3]